MYEQKQLDRTIFDD